MLLSESILKKVDLITSSSTGLILDRVRSNLINKYVYAYPICGCKYCHLMMKLEFREMDYQDITLRISMIDEHAELCAQERLLFVRNNRKDLESELYAISCSIRDIYSEIKSLEKCDLY